MQRLGFLALTSTLNDHRTTVATIGLLRLVKRGMQNPSRRQGKLKPACPNSALKHPHAPKREKVQLLPKQRSAKPAFPQQTWACSTAKVSLTACTTDARNCGDISKATNGPEADVEAELEETIERRSNGRQRSLKKHWRMQHPDCYVCCETY